MAETPKSRRSKSLARSAKSVSFSESSEFIPSRRYNESVPAVPKRFRQSDPPVPYHHATDDFIPEGERCCELWPYCGDARSALSYSEKDDSDNDEDLDDDFRGRSRESAYFRYPNLDDEPSTSNVNEVEGHGVAPWESDLSINVPDDRRIHYRYGHSERTLVNDVNESTQYLRRDMFDDAQTIRSSIAPSITKGSLLGEEEDLDIEKNVYIPRISVIPPPPQADPYLVKFDGPRDRLNPKSWPSKKKWRMTFCVASFTFLAPLASSMPAPALLDIAHDFGISTSSIKLEIVLSIFVLAFAVGPVVFGPLSELYGRVIVLQCANVLFLTFTLACGFARSTGQIMAFRFLAGLGGSAPLAIGGGVLGDLFPPEERGKAMAIYGIGPLLGPSIGPILGSFISAYSTWRWMFWATAAASLVILSLSFIFLEESYAPLLLKRKAARLRECSGIQFYQSEYDNKDRTVTKSITNALTRALKMLFTQPLVQVLALYMAYAYGTMYLMLTTFPTLWTEKFHEAKTLAGLNYLSLGLGFFLGAPIIGKSTDTLYRYLSAKDNASASAPTRKPVLCEKCMRQLVEPQSAISVPVLPPLAHLPLSSSSPSITTIPQPSTSTPPPPNPSLTNPPNPTSTAPAKPPQRPPRGKPEHRLPLLIPFSLLPPLGLLLYGWSAQLLLSHPSSAAAHILPNLGAFIFSLGTVAAFQCITTYLIDVYMLHAASAIAAVTVARSLAGFGFPIFAGKMFERLGFGGGCSLLAGVAGTVGVGSAVGLWRWGEKLRLRTMSGKGAMPGKGGPGR